MALPVGPVLARVLDAQQHQDEALRYPNIAEYATAVAGVARRIRADTLWPVDRGAERLLGAVAVLTCGDLTTREWQTMVRGQRVLLIGTVGLSSVEFTETARRARVAGARAVHGCGIDEALAGPGLDSFTVLVAPTDARSKTA